ncbi:MAG: accessory gene regulator B family protein [Oscillospiraceae bacterium]|nr:accessory gene regulator B family protein [Oscillospiraceae bacterium]
MEKLIDKIIDTMKVNNSLTDDEEIVRYGLEIIIIKAIFIVSIIIVSIFMKCLAESIFFTISYSLIRQYGGGSHASTKRECFVRSMLTLIFALCIIKAAENIFLFIFPIFVISLAAVVYIFIFAPIDSENKRLDKDEIRVYGKKAKVMTILMLLTAVALLFIKLNAFAVAVMTGIATAAFLMFVGQIQNFKCGDRQ